MEAFLINFYEIGYFLCKLHCQADFIKPLLQSVFVERIDFKRITRLIGACDTLRFQIHRNLRAGIVPQLPA